MVLAHNGSAGRESSYVMMSDLPFSPWETPAGVIEARVYEVYTGLRGQQRIGLVDRQGRVWHYDAILIAGSFMKSRGWLTWDELLSTLRAPKVPFSWRNINEDDANLPPFGVIRDAD